MVQYCVIYIQMVYTKLKWKKLYTDTMELAIYNIGYYNYINHFVLTLQFFKLIFY